MLGLSAGYLFVNDQQTERRPDIQGLLWPEPKQLADFSLIDQAGREFRFSNLLNKWSFIFFGYTNCPDICPATLAILKEVNDMLEKTGGVSDVQTIFVTVDPERDSIQKLKEYTGYFNPDFTGLGGTEEQVSSLAGQIGIFHQKSQLNDSENYLVDHTASIFLVDPKGRLIAIFSAPHQVEQILKSFRQIRSYLENSS